MSDRSLFSTATCLPLSETSSESYIAIFPSFTAVPVVTVLSTLQVQPSPELGGKRAAPWVCSANKFKQSHL